MHLEQQCIGRLRQQGERVTAPRLMIFRLLVRHSPIKMARLIALAKRDSIDQVTVYRTIRLFKQLEIADEVGWGSNRRFELSGNYHAHHHHATCLRCGNIADFDSQALEQTIAAVVKATGFTMRSHQVEITGLCSACKNTR